MTQEKKDEQEIKEQTPDTETNNTSEKKEEKTACEEKKTSGKCKKEHEKTAELEKQISELTDKIAKEKESYIRLMAEFDNFRRRTSQEKLDLVSVAAEETIKGLLPILDDCERALEVLRKSEDSAAAIEGTELIYTKLLTYLKGKGLEIIDAKGNEFDTDLHEAVAQFPVQDDAMKGKIYDVIQTGYTLNGKVIRFAKVVVGN